LHVLLELPDHLDSTSIVVDKDTGELVERTTYMANGEVDSDLRLKRWEYFREDYQFTGKEDDIEVGLQYFGKRYFAPNLGTWISADPLTIHRLGGDLNAYAYVHGSWLRQIDPVGLQDRDAGATPTDVSGADKVETTPAFDPSHIQLPETVIVGVPEYPPAVALLRVNLGHGGSGAANGVYPNTPGGAFGNFAGENREVFEDLPVMGPAVKVVEGAFAAADGKTAEAVGKFASATVDVAVDSVTFGAMSGEKAAVSTATKTVAGTERAVAGTERAAAAVARTDATVSRVATRLCFPAGTPVATAAGTKLIEEIRPGDQVLTVDVDEKVTSVHVVTHTFESLTDELVSIRYDGDQIEATPSHPFWIVGRGWTRADELAAGMSLLAADGRSRQVLETAHRPTIQVVFNLEVEGAHTYFVGSEPVLVHNQTEAFKNFNSAIARAFEWLHSQGVDTSTLTQVRDFKFGGRGLTNAAGNIGFRIEWDPKIGAHINVFNRKVIGPHLTFPGNEKSVKTLLRVLFCR
jgi:RHS repeat-associated protein